MTTVWKSENNLREWAPSFQPVGLRMKLDSQNSTLAPCTISLVHAIVDFTLDLSHIATVHTPQMQQESCVLYSRLGIQNN